MLTIAGGIVLGFFAIAIILAFAEEILSFFSVALTLALFMICLGIALILVSEIPLGVTLTVVSTGIAIVVLSKFYTTVKSACSKNAWRVVTRIAGACSSILVFLCYIIIQSSLGLDIFTTGAVTFILGIGFISWMKLTFSMFESVSAEVDKLCNRRSADARHPQDSGVTGNNGPVSKADL